MFSNISHFKTPPQQFYSSFQKLFNMSSTTSTAVSTTPAKQYVFVSPKVLAWLETGLVAKSSRMDKASSDFIKKVIAGTEKLERGMFSNIESVIGRIDPNGPFFRESLEKELVQFDSYLY